jgi:hypothetical protein
MFEMHGTKYIENVSRKKSFRETKIFFFCLFPQCFKTEIGLQLFIGSMLAGVSVMRKQSRKN